MTKKDISLVLVRANIFLQNKHWTQGIKMS